MRISDWSSDVCSSDLHEERVAYEGGIADDVGRAGGGMDRRVHHAGFEGADREGLAVLAQLVELAPVRSEARFPVEDTPEPALHAVATGADGGAAAELCRQRSRGGKVVGVQTSGRQPC